MILIIITLALLLISFLKDRRKTLSALKIAYKKFSMIFIPLLFILIVVSIVLFLLPGDTISKYLTDSGKYIAVLSASLLGSITMMPGFIAFPLSGILKQNGVFYMVISAFTTTLMMVGIITFPIEKKYFGARVAVLRNVISFLIALMVSLVTGILFGEIF